MVSLFPALTNLRTSEASECRYLACYHWLSVQISRWFLQEKGSRNLHEVLKSGQQVFKKYSLLYCSYPCFQLFLPYLISCWTFPTRLFGLGLLCYSCLALPGCYYPAYSAVTTWPARLLLPGLLGCYYLTCSAVTTWPAWLLLPGLQGYSCFALLICSYLACSAVPIWPWPAVTTWPALQFLPSPARLFAPGLLCCFYKSYSAVRTRPALLFLPSPARLFVPGLLCFFCPAQQGCLHVACSAVSTYPCSALRTWPALLF